uniref:Uncharacterized protein n=1 Tax=Arundo donax TaxID=35708 RepID=A0A0A8XX08_ARUDO
MIHWKGIQSVLGYDCHTWSSMPFHSTLPAGTQEGKTTPPGYICYRCRIPGIIFRIARQLMVPILTRLKQLGLLPYYCKSFRWHPRITCPWCISECCR